MKRYSIIIPLIGVFLLGLIILFINASPPILGKLFPSTIRSEFPTPTTQAIPTLTIDSIFSSDHTWTLALPDDKKVVLIGTGDIIPARSVNYGSVKRNDFTWSFTEIAPLLSSGDITVANLETPLLRNCPVTVDGMIFCGSRSHIEGILKSGIDVVGFANNHMGNYGEEGIVETQKLMEENDILVTGISGPTYKTVKGTRFAFLAYNEIGTEEPRISWLVEKKNIDEVKNAKKEADVVVVLFHWGVEYVDRPSEEQRLIAKKTIDAGADLILGNHPHWIQGLEFYKDKLIVYAQGNTIFDQMWSEETKKGVIGKYIFYKNTLIDVDFIPTYIVNYGQSTILAGDKKQHVLDYMKRVSFFK